VMAATFPEQLVALHDVIPDATPLLIPGIGKQKGELESTLKNAQRYPFVINSSGAIIHASRGSDFAAVAAQKAKALRDQINEALASLAAWKPLASLLRRWCHGQESQHWYASGSFS